MDSSRGKSKDNREGNTPEFVRNAFYNNESDERDPGKSETRIIQIRGLEMLSTHSWRAKILALLFPKRSEVNAEIHGFAGVYADRGWPHA
jgi:hypothetical protein